MRKFKSLSLGLVVLMLGALLLAVCPTVTEAAPLKPAVTTIYAEVSAKYFPRTDGKTVVWTDNRPGNDYILKPDIYAARLSDGQRFTIASGELDQRNADVDGDWVVWQQGASGCDSPLFTFNALSIVNACSQRDIYAKNLATGQTLAVADTPTDEADPAISGGWAVWFSKSADGIYSLQARNLVTLTPAITLAQLGASPYARPALDGTQVAWLERPLKGGAWRVLSCQLSSCAPVVVDEGPGTSQGPNGLDIRAGLAVYSVYLENPARYELRATNLAMRQARVVASSTSLKFAPVTDGRFVVWQETSSAGRNPTFNMLGFDLQTNTAFDLFGFSNIYFSPDLAGGVLVWMSYEQGGAVTTKINTAPIRDYGPVRRLPTTPVDPPPGPNSNVTYFPQTGHTLAYGFRYFWENNGGLPVFGYPQTEEFSETNPDKKQPFTVQYFERQRYEYHPENKGTPYETELGRLGADAALRLKLTNTAPFQPLPNNYTATNCQYFGQTRHSVCGLFLTYWQTHGLEFGDAGTSYREALALFGLPLSQEYKDAATGLTIQYFERAVFEYHPENKGTPYEVLLQRLGADLLTQRGWLPLP